MRNLIPWKELHEADTEAKYSLLQDSFNITKGEIDSVKTPLQAGELLFRKGLELGLETYEALSQVKTHTLAALVDGEHKNSALKLSRKLKDRYGHLKENGEPYIHFLREEVFERVYNRALEANYERSNAWGVEFSDHDFKRGTKIPFPLDEKGHFFCGVGSSIGSLQSNKQFLLSPSKKRNEFLEEIVKPVAKDLFNLELYINEDEVSKKSGFNGETYTFTRYEPSITSKAFSQFAERYMLDDIIPSVLGEYSCEGFLSYFSGVVNARATLGKENNGLILTMINKHKKEFLDTICDIGCELGFKGRVKPKNDSYMLRYPAKEVEKMKETTLDLYRDSLFGDYKGIFCNPVQLRKLNSL